ncbi:MAG: class II fructose-bisphosphate aldolase [Candidatus Wildermuthbacteria bacterium]|nr:class II fructose-bisphosphate aldolase [Candidatus Wildermuthbacteria bacterium]
MQKDLSYWFQKATKEHWALAQFNFSCAEQLKGIVQAAVALRSPLLLGTSEGDSNFFGLAQAVAMVGAWRRTTGLPIFLNFDHGKSFETVAAAIEAGYDAVHFDGSHFPLEENIAITKKVVALAKKNKISVVEGEFGEIPGKHSDIHLNEEVTLDPSVYTDPEEAHAFVEQTKVSSLAIIIGNVHGVYAKVPRLDLMRLQKIQKRVESFLVLHGGSGTPEEDMKGAIRLGVVKINISTDLRAAFVQGLRDVLSEHPEEVTPSKLLGPSVELVQKAAEKNILLFGSAGKIC